MFKGSYPALITPFRNGAFDEDAYVRLIEWQIAEGTHGIVPVGTTGESPTLSHEEHMHVVEVAIAAAKKRVPVIAGCGSNSTHEAIELTRHAKEVGATAALHVLPYYNKPTQEGQFQHLKAINDAVDLPIIIYNIPGRTGIEMTVATMARCFKELKNVIGVKDSTSKLERVSLQRIACKRPDREFVQLSGEDGSALALRAHGGHGCISVTANVAPRLCADFQNACTRGDFKAALDIQDRLMPLHDALFCETSPGPVKYAASRLGLCSAEMRLPMAPISEASKKIVDEALAKVGLSNLAQAAE
jgi:4-hydroxy-tetrahydrodipicolinate synthase